MINLNAYIIDVTYVSINQEMFSNFREATPFHKAGDRENVNSKHRNIYTVYWSNQNSLA